MYDSSDAAGTALAEYNHRELSTAVYIIDEAGAPAVDLFAGIITECIPRLEEFAADDLVQMSTVFHKHGVHSADWYRAVSFHLKERLDEVLPGGIAALVTLMAREDVLVADLFKKAAALVAKGINHDIERQNTFTPGQQASVAAACHQAEYAVGALAYGLAGSVEKHPTAYTPEQVKAIEGYVKFCDAVTSSFEGAVASHAAAYEKHLRYLEAYEKDDSPIFTLGQTEDLQQRVVRKARVFLQDGPEASAQ